MWPPALQRAVRPAKGKDNVLAALIGVCGCHILITLFKKKEKKKEEKKKVTSHFGAGMQSKSTPLPPPPGLEKLGFSCRESFTALMQRSRL